MQDLVLDLLKEKQSQKQVLRSYRDSQEPKKVKNAVLDGTEDTDCSPTYSAYRYVLNVSAFDEVVNCLAENVCM